MGKKSMGGVSEARLEALERQLKGALQPISPSREMLARVRGRIRIPAREEIADRLRNWNSLVLVLGGVLAGAVVLITVARGLYHLFGRRGGA